MFQDKDGPSRASPRETCGDQGSYQTPTDHSSSQSCWDGVINEPAGCAPRTRPHHTAQSSRTQTLAQRSGPFRLCPEEGSSHHTRGFPMRERLGGFLPQLPSKCLTLLSFSSRCRGPGDDFYGGQALKRSYRRDGECLSQLAMLCGSRHGDLPDFLMASLPFDSVEHSPALNGTGALWLQQRRLDPALNACSLRPEPGEVMSTTSAMM